MWDWQYFAKYFFIFYRKLSVPRNIDMDLDNVMHVMVVDQVQKNQWASYNPDSELKILIDQLKPEVPTERFWDFDINVVLLYVEIERFKVISPVPMKFLGIVGQDPSDSKSNWLHVDIFRFYFIHMRYVLP